ncbi:hypothetical protein [Streptomyces spectabilis]|uniref:Bulb-type lectin domain-containing protein n=1 Tax=Streptomyces spectabilis TaxID=68270 RepID=A0A516RJ04_STRST|nr:hypothetical protein [Streptomyces spectabilis]QDQ15629.1 hypothetical protein FH965_37975 [Streptomyces spectabilis]
MSNNDVYPNTPSSTIHRNMAWTSGTGRTLLRLQEDGNFVVYRDSVEKPVWSPDTRPDGYRAVLQGDGNLVVYAQDDRPVWASNTSGRHGAVLSVQDDGNVCIYYQGQPIWCTETAG